MKIGVIGFGNVGKAITAGFRSKNFQVYVNDKRNIESEKNYSKKFIVKNSDIIFICVDTPTVSGKPYIKNLLDVFSEITAISGQYYDSCDDEPIIVLKSTVPPGTTEKLYKKYNKIVSNPEFLTEKNALNDFLNPDRVVIGSNNDKSIDKMKKLYASWQSQKIITSPTSAELIKYLSNTYLVYKVAFSQLAYEICKCFDVNADEIMDVVTLDHRIHPSHLKPSMGKIPTDSHCLPKDISALIYTIKSHNGDTKYLEAIKRQGIKSCK